MCRVLQIAPSTYHAAKTRPPSPRALRDAELRPEVLRVWEQNLAVYGADKVWHHLNHEDGVTRRPLHRRAADDASWACRAAGGAGCSCAPPIGDERSSGPPIWSSASSGPRPRTGCGSPT